MSANDESGARAGSSPDAGGANDQGKPQGAASPQPVEEPSRRDSEILYRELFESTGDAIMLVDAGGFIQCNEATLRLFRCRRREDFLSKHPSQVSPPYQPDGTDSRTAANARMQRAYRDGLHRFEWMHRREDGTDFMADVLLARVDLTGGSILQAVVRDISQWKRVEHALREAQEQLEHRVEARTAELARANEELRREVSERRRAEARLLEAMEEARQANRAKSDFLANMSHEIRTPMNAITGMTELLLDTPLSDAQREYLTMVRDSSESLLSIINDILDFSKIEAGKLELQSATFDVREVCGDTMKSMALRAHLKGLELVCEVCAEVPQWLVGDAGRVRQVIVNLVGNAIKFTDRGEILLDVACRDCEHGNALLHCRVVDTGVGIDPRKRKAIFNAFEQADTSSTRRYGGTGLGLAISRRLVEAMGGEIWVESKLGAGSTFHFTMRLAVSDSAPVVGRQQQVEAVQGARVLVVDDNATNVRVLTHILQNWHMRSATASSVAEALRQIVAAERRGEPFQLVLTDLNMPEQDGFDLARQVRHNRRLQQPVMLLLTSGGRPDDLARCEQYQIASCLFKPVKQSELFDAIVESFGIAQAAGLEASTLPTTEHRAIGPLRVLLAEDSLVNQRLAVGLLQKHGHHVDVVADGRAAVEAVTADSYDLVLMDVQMPVMDGLEATRAIRERERAEGGHLPIVAMTAHAMKGDRERCLEAGMDDYVSKPIHARDVLRTIQEVMTRADVSQGQRLDDSGERQA